MTLQQAVVLAALALLVALLVRGRQSPAALFAGVALLFYVLDYISLERLLLQFTNTGLVAVLLLILVSVVLDKSRLLERLAERLVRGSYPVALLRLVLTTAAYSAFLNNTAVVASLIGPLRANRHHGAARLLMPMCYAATLGGVLTLVGTSTNLLISGFMVGQGMAPLGIFTPLPVGLMLLAGCSLAMCLSYPWLFRHRTPVAEAPGDYFLEARVLPGSALIGRTVHDNGLRHLGHLFLSEIVRDGRLLAPVEPDERLAAGDLLVFAGDVQRLDLLSGFHGLQTYGQRSGLPLDNLVEVVIGANSTLARRTLREVDFRSQFDAAVVAVRRGNERLAGAIGQIPLQVGDALVLAVGKDFDKRNNVQRNFIVVSRPTVAKFVDPRKSLGSLVGFVLVIGAAALGWVGLVKGLLLLLTAYLLFGLTRSAELRRNVPYGLVFIIAGALVISEVMLSSGVARLVSGGVLALVAPLGRETGALIGVLLLSWLLTELMSNNAAAALAFPVALGMAQQTGLPALPLVMAVLYGASCSFLTPFGYQTNLMIMAPGQYGLRDYLRAGAPVTIVYLGIAIWAIPMVFPLQ